MYPFVTVKSWFLIISFSEGCAISGISTPAPPTAEAAEKLRLRLYIYLF